jgi:hypothetical protein
MQKSTNQKPIYYFTGAASSSGSQMSVGGVIDHPCGYKYVLTSTVVYKYDDGSFETLNSVYVPFSNKK